MAGTYTITVLTAPILVPRIELGTSRVLSERHNQLDHTSSNGVSGFRSPYLVLAKDARFRLRQYPEDRADKRVAARVQT